MYLFNATTVVWKIGKEIIMNPLPLKKIVPATKRFVPFNDKEIIVVEGIHTEHEY